MALLSRLPSDAGQALVIALEALASLVSQDHLTPEVLPVLAEAIVLPLFKARALLLMLMILAPEDNSAISLPAA